MKSKGRFLGETKTGGRAATQGVIQGQVALSVGNPETRCPPGWKWTALTDVARLETGHTPSRQHPEWWGGDVPWIGIRDATGNHGRKIYETAQYTNELGIANSSARILPANTVCLSRTASVGYVVVMGVPMATSQDFVNWVCGPNLDWRYLKYVLLSETESLKRFSYGTTHQTIYFPEVKAFHVCLPPIEEQRRIADILSALDDKIEVNRRMAATLEEMARTVFRSWFVDFDPVRAKVAAMAEGRDPKRAAMAALSGRPEIDLDTLSPETLASLAATVALFPDGITSERNRDVPTGWVISSLLDYAEVLSGGTPSTQEADFWDGSIPWASAKDVSQCSDPFLISTERSITEAGLQSSPTKMIPAGATVLVARGATAGRYVLFGKPMAMNQTCYGLVASEPYFLNLIFGDLVDGLLASAHGSVFSTFTVATLRHAQVVLPPAEMRRSFESLVAPLYRRLLSCVEESQMLAATRDTLLPRLLSGDLSALDERALSVA